MLIRNGGAEEDRTPDLLRARQALSQLSYGPVVLSERPELHNAEAVYRQCGGHDAGLSGAKTLAIWWVWVDLNHRPHPYQGCALTN